MFQVIALNEYGEEVNLVGEMDLKEDADKAAKELNKMVAELPIGAAMIISESPIPTDELSERLDDNQRIVVKAIVKEV
ncbi:hypothetical protein LCGC14_1547770 [marine sediment metagenome]|uniref:Uncharacterized protein n=1 Tax=marine sediment metagenome TaxID=412755 RepID=A0A0F9IR83_9ZZZZ|nr:hypothetical protein [Candidatus Scalindua sp.]HDZ15723.1 hypothetical protein [Pricia sp.]